MRRSLVALALISCGPRYEYARYAPPAPVTATVAAEAPPEVDIPKILEAVIRVRGLSPISEIPIRKLDDADFDMAFRTANGVGADDKPRSATLNSKFFDGFYAYASRSICVRAHPVLKQSDSRIILAHELVHALQHQHFDTDRLKEAASKSRDEQLALKALLEGDAQLSAMGAVALLDGVPPHRAMITTAALRASEDAAVAVGDDVAALSYDERVRLVFPYEDGERFVGTVYRAGGFDLVNRLYVTPPKTTAFIAHPDVYLAGVPIRPVPPIFFPKEANMTAVQGSRMGEVGLRELLVHMGSQPNGAEELSASWRGDWLGVGKRPDGQAAVGGAVVFSNEQDAEVARVIMHGDRRGVVVTFVDGLPPAQAAAMRRDALDTPIPDPPASPPFGQITIPPPPVPIERQARFGGVYDGRTFTDVGVGLSLPIANAYRVSINGDALLKVTDGHKTMAAALFDFGQSAHARAQVKASILGAARQLGLVVAYTDATVASSLGPALERTVQLSDGRVFAAVLLPMCASRATLFMAELSSPGDAFANRQSVTLHDWLFALDPKGIEGGEFCRAVDEEWTTELQ